MNPYGNCFYPMMQQQSARGSRGYTAGGYPMQVAAPQAFMSVVQPGQMAYFNGAPGLSQLQPVAGSLNFSDSQRIDMLAEAVKRLAEAQLSNNRFIESRGGTIGSYDGNAGLGNGGVYDGSLYKGGVGVPTDSVAILDDSVAGTQFVLPWSGNQLNRITGTTFCRLGGWVSGSGILEDEAQKIQATLRINGEPVNSFRRVPLNRVLTTLDGNERQAAINEIIPLDVSVDILLEVIVTLSGSGNTNDVYFSADAGDNCMVSCGGC